jgi:hypothetical protein
MISNEEMYMHYTRGQYILSLASIVFGIAIIIATARISLLGFAGGGFFTVIGLGSLLLTLGSGLPGLPGRILSHRFFKAVIIVAVVAMLALTFYFAINY